MNKINLIVKLIITILGLILIFSNLENKNIWYIIFVTLVIIYLIYDSISNRKKKEKS